MSQEESIIEYDKGANKVQEEGIKPFLKLVESGQRDFFKAKDFVALYDLIFKMCIQRDPYNWSEKMYALYTASIQKYLDASVSPGLARASESYGDALLKEWNARWNNQKLVVKGLAKLFMYLDRFYTPNTDGIKALNEQGFELYKTSIFDTYCKTACSAILNSIEKERKHEPQDRQLLQDAVTCFVEVGHFVGKKLQVYKQCLENDVVQNAGAFYKRQSRMWMDQDSAPNYLEKAERMLLAEKNRVESYLNRSTLEPLTRECYVQLLQVHQKELLQKPGTGIDNMLKTNNAEDLSRLFRLYSKYPTDLDPIADAVNAHISAAGSAIVSSANSSEGGDAKEGKEAKEENHDLVTKLIDLHDTYNKIVQNCFEKSAVFLKALKQAFQDFINKDDRVSKLLAKYVNDVLKKGTTQNVSNLEETLNNIVFIYGYIHEKDVFERNYQLFLAHRLLNGLCESEHSEKSMIAKLKTECGYQWTNKLEGMFKDVQLSKELMNQFKNVFDTEKSLDMTLDVSVCTTGYWPSSKSIPALLPAAVATACTNYKNFYLNKHSGHKLEWRLDQGRAEVQVAFSPKVKRTLVVTTYQMMVLVVFNEAKVATLKEIMDITGVPKFELAAHILSMCHPKIGVLLKKPNSKSLEPDHAFMLNPKYFNKLKKVIVPLMAGIVEPGTGGPSDEDEDAKAIELQRRHQMDAAVVRIMKTRKQLRHNLLVAEVISQLQVRFKPRPSDIKKRIEALIEQEYLERDKSDRSLYNYLA